MRWKIGNCEFDSIKRVISRPMSETELGGSDTKVLRVLIKHFGDEDFSDEQIRREAWEGEMSLNRLSKSIEALRDAFGGEERTAFIASRPYRLIEIPERLDTHGSAVAPQKKVIPSSGYLLNRTRELSSEMKGNSIANAGENILNSMNDGSRRTEEDSSGELPLFVDGIFTRAQIDQVIGTVEERFENALEEVWISGNDNAFVAKSLSPTVTRALRKGRKIRLMGVDPDSPAAAMLSLIDPRFEGNTFKREIGPMTEIAREWHKSYPKSFEYRLLPILPALGFFITDPTLPSKTVKIEIYTAKPWEPFESRPHLVFNEYTPEWREYFIKQFENYWDLSTSPFT